MFKSSLILAILLAGLPFGGQAEERFGRFFTTPKQRQYMNEIRERQPREELMVEITEEEIPSQENRVEERVPLNLVRLKGLVYRHGDNKSTAWLNDGNSFEGDIGSQYITVDHIDPRSVTLDIAGDRVGIKLKAGQAYEPASKKIHEVIKQ